MSCLGVMSDFLLLIIGASCGDIVNGVATTMPKSFKSLWLMACFAQSLLGQNCDLYKSWHLK